MKRIMAQNQTLFFLASRKTNIFQPEVWNTAWKRIPPSPPIRFCNDIKYSPISVIYSQIFEDHVGYFLLYLHEHRANHGKIFIFPLMFYPDDVIIDDVAISKVLTSILWNHKRCSLLHLPNDIISDFHMAGIDFYSIIIYFKKAIFDNGIFSTRYAICTKPPSHHFHIAVMTTITS